MLSTAYYFLQVVFCSAVMMGYYWLVLRDKKFHQYNRFYLLSVLLLSWVIPIIKIQWTKPVASDVQVINFLSIVADNNAEIDASLAKNSYQFTWEGFAVAAYFLIAAIMFGLLVMGLIRLYVLLKQHSCKNIGDVYLILTQVKGTPFSFFRYIFWHEAIDLRSDAGKKMLEHELTHVQQKHSIDKVLIQVVLIVGWFNPFFWLLKKEMEMIHEFIADNKSVQNGDSASLAELLLTAAYPQQKFLLTTPFFFSPIKRRLQMITNNKNPRFSYLRRLVILPLLAIVVVLVAFRSKSVDPTRPLSVGSLMETFADKINGNQQNPSLQLFRTFNLNKTYTVVIDAGHGGTDHGALSATEIVTEAELTLQLAKAVKEANTNQNIKIVLTRESDVFNSVVEKADFANAQNPDYFISLHINADEKNVKATGVEFIIPQNDQSKRYVQSGQLAGNFGVALSEYSVNVNKIHSVEKGVWILKSVKCPSVLIEAGYITNASDLNKLKNKDYQNKMALAILQGLNSYLSNSEKYANRPIIDTAIVRAKDSSKNNSFVVVSDSIIFRETGKKPLIILDGKIQPNSDVNKINPNTIEKIEVLKNESATIVYGDAGKNGVILITSKVAVKDPIKITLDVPRNALPKNVVYFVDAVIVDSLTMSKIEPSSIATVNVWKGEKALNKFGVDAGVGVIEIITKKREVVVSDQLEKVFTEVEAPASFPGGTIAWTKYLERNLKTSFLNQQNAPPGKYTIIVSFQISDNGMVSNVHSQNDPGYGTKEEAERIIKKGPSWIPAMQNGKNVASIRNQSITFVVSEKK